MIRVTHTQIEQLRGRKVINVTVPPAKPAEGAKKGKVPYVESRNYTAYAPREVDEETDKERPRITLPVFVLAYQLLQEGDYEIAIRMGAVDESKLLKARTGGDEDGDGEGDYTASPARAMRDEPEAVSDAELDRQASDARNAEQRRLDYVRVQNIRHLETAIMRMQEVCFNERQAKYLGQMRTTLKRLQRELRGP